MVKKALIIGGGISGLTAAYALQKQGAEVTLLESSGKLGGAVQTYSEQGYLAEAGPNSMQVTTVELEHLLSELGLTQQIVRTSPFAKKRFLMRNGTLYPAPSGPGSLLKTPLFSFRAKLRLITEILNKKKSRGSDQSLAHFVKRRLGDDLLNYAVNPMVAGIYAGDPEKLSTQYAFPTLWKWEQAYGSLLKGFLKSGKAKCKTGTPFKPYMISFKRGMSTLVHGLEKKLDSHTIHLNSTIDAIDYLNQQWNVSWTSEDNTYQQTFDKLILSTPAFALKNIPLPQLLSPLITCLSQIEYPPISNLILGFRKGAIKRPLDGFGVLIPECEKKNSLGIIFSSSLFENRAPAGHETITLFIGGTRQPAHAHLPQNELLALAKKDLNEILGIEEEPTFVRHHFWEKAIPQYNLGYERYLNAIERAETQFSGLHIVNNYRGGIAVGNCLQNGMAVTLSHQ